MRSQTVAHSPGRTLARLCRGFQCMGNLVERRRQPIEQPAPLLRRRDAARGARQQANAKARLQAADSMAYRRGRHAKLAGRPAKTAMGGDGGEHRELGELSAIH